MLFDTNVSLSLCDTYRAQYQNFQQQLYATGNGPNSGNNPNNNNNRGGGNQGMNSGPPPGLGGGFYSSGPIGGGPK